MKRLFRKWLRKRIYVCQGASSERVESMFNWVYNAPIWEWRTRMFCVRYSQELKEAERLYGWLNDRQHLSKGSDTATGTIAFQQDAQE